MGKSNNSFSNTNALRDGTPIPRFLEHFYFKQKKAQNLCRGNEPKIFSQLTKGIEMKTHPQSNTSKGLSQETKQLNKLGSLRKHFKARITTSKKLGNYDFVRFFKKELYKIDTERWELAKSIGGLL